MDVGLEVTVLVPARLPLDSMNERMFRWLSTFFRKHQFLVQLLSWAHACVDNGNVNLGAKPSHANHLSRQVIDANSLAHLQHEDVTALGIACCLDDQSGRSRHVHEVTRHVGVRDRDRATEVDLLGESWDDTPTAAEHVSESHRRAAGRRARTVAISGPAND